MLDTTSKAGLQATRSATRPSRALPALLALLALVAALPFLAVDLPSMTDLPGHIGRYHVMLAIDRSAWLHRYYAFDWHLLGNLGVDLIVRAIGPWQGVQTAARLTVAGIAVLTVAGIAAVSRVAHGRIQPTVAVAACFVLCNPLMFGFVNYCLAWALALLAFAAWIALRERSRALHLIAMTPLVALVWLAHAMGWGVLGLMVAGFEAERLWQRRRARDRGLADAWVRFLPFVPPLLLTLAWRQASGGALYAYGSAIVTRKIMNWIVVLRGEAAWIDIGTPVVLGAGLAVLAWRGRARIDWRLANGGILLAAATLVMPMTLFGSWGADERIVPAAVILLALSLAWEGSRHGATTLALVAAALMTGRTVLIVRDWRALDARYTTNLRALQSVPRGARIHAMVLGDRCRTGWRSTAYLHLPSLAIDRRDALVNSQWAMQGATLLRVIYPVPERLRNDPSQQIAAFDCAGQADLGPLRARLAELSPAQWDYAWVLATRGAAPLWPGHRPVYADADSALYRVR